MVPTDIWEIDNVLFDTIEGKKNIIRIELPVI